MAEIMVNNDNFISEVIESKTPVLVDFFATWCGPCKMIAPIIEEIAEEYEGSVKVCKIDVDEAPEFASRYGIMSIPTLLLFNNGEIINTSVGYTTKEKIVNMIENA